jgi:hypothetical protein
LGACSQHWGPSPANADNGAAGSDAGQAPDRLRFDFPASLFSFGISDGERPGSRRGAIKAIKRWRESLFHSLLVDATNAQSVRDLRGVVRNLLHLIRRVCVHRENSTPQFRDVVHSPIVAPIVAQRVVTTGSNAGGLFG